LGELLQQGAKIVGSQQGHAYANMRSGMLDPLFCAGWELDQALLHYQIVGLLPITSCIC
jgi:hypothetical protein